MTARTLDLVVVGGGPRAVAVVARLAARLRPDAAYGTRGTPSGLLVAVVDAVEVGAGATWRTDQHPLLLNNTYAAHTTAHADDSTPMSGPVVPGPDLVAWARTAHDGTDTHLPRPPRPAWVPEEVARLRPESYPTRRLQGVYYREQLAEAAWRGGIEVLHVRGTAIDLALDGADTDGVLEPRAALDVDPALGVDPALVPAPRPHDDPHDPSVDGSAPADERRHAPDQVLAEQAVTGDWHAEILNAEMPNAQISGAEIRGAERPVIVRLGGADVVALDGAEGHRALGAATAPLTELVTSHVALAQGMVQSRRSRRSAEMIAAAERGGLVYLEPGMPSERDWDAVPSGEDVLVAGLGANFFDVVGILTGGRGGRFVDAVTGADVDAVGRSTDDGGAAGPAAGAELVYRPSGREPRLLVGSRRGLPYRGKGAYPAEVAGFPPRWEPRIATAAALRRAARGSVGGAGSDSGDDSAESTRCTSSIGLPDSIGSADSGRSADGARSATSAGSVASGAARVVDLVVRELALAHLLTLAQHHPAELRHRIDEAGLVRALSRRPVAEVLGELLVERGHLDLEHPDRAPETTDLEAWRAWVQCWVSVEQDSIAAPLQSARNAVNRAMNTSRGLVARLVAGGLLDGLAVAELEASFVPRGLTLSSGPPPRRTAQLLALVRAGVVELLGPGMQVTVDDGGFCARTAVHPDGVRTRAFVETRMSKGQVGDAADPLLRALLDSGRARLHRRSSTLVPDGVVSESLDVERGTCVLLDGAGSREERVRVIGIPAEAVQPGSAIGATPGVPSPLLAGADVVAAATCSAFASARDRQGRRVSEPA